MEFMPEHAPLTVVAFLGTAAFLAVASAAALVAFWMRKKWIGIAATLLAFLFTCGYALVLVGVSLTSHEKTLAPGENKYFCEMDCHIAYSVVDFEEAKALAMNHSRLCRRALRDCSIEDLVRSGHYLQASRRRYLNPKSTACCLVDEAGISSAITSGAGSPGQVARRYAPLSQPLRPGESYVTELFSM